jgi:hypothetical protein
MLTKKLLQPLKPTLRVETDFSNEKDHLKEATRVELSQRSIRY